MKKIIPVIILIIVTTLFISKCIVDDHIIITDAREYGDFYGFRGHSNLNIFPEDIYPETIDSEYYFEYKDEFLDPYYQIYLKCSYDKGRYSKEVARLSHVYEQYEEKTQEIKYDVNNFNYPAYVSIFADDYCYEYALLDEDKNTIVYVYTQFAKEKKIQFDKNYLPFNYMEESENAFSIYMFDIGDGVRHISNEKYRSK